MNYTAWPLDQTLQAVVPVLINSMNSEDPRTRGVIASVLCRMVADVGLEGSVPPILRSALEAVVASLKDRDPVFRRYLLIELLNENPSELFMPHLCALLEARPSSARATFGVGPFHLERRDLVADRQSQTTRPLAPRPFDHRPLAQGHEPRFHAAPPEALFDEDVVVRFGAYSAFDRFLENDKSLFTASSPATRTVMPELRRAEDRRPELRMWAATAGAQNWSPAHGERTINP